MKLRLKYKVYIRIKMVCAAPRRASSPSWLGPAHLFCCARLTTSSPVLSQGRNPVPTHRFYTEAAHTRRRTARQHGIPAVFMPPLDESLSQGRLRSSFLAVTTVDGLPGRPSSHCIQLDRPALKSPPHRFGCPRAELFEPQPPTQTQHRHTHAGLPYPSRDNSPS